jgi:hypothetical protein
MRRKVGIVVTAIVLTAAIGMVVRSGIVNGTQQGAGYGLASSTTVPAAAAASIFPFELQKNADKNLPVEVHGDPF